MISSFIQLQVDTLSQAATNAVADKLPVNTEISVLEFIFKGGFFLLEFKCFKMGIMFDIPFCLKHVIGLRPE